MAIGTAILGEETGEILGRIQGILLHPDRATVEGFFAQVPHGFLDTRTDFVSSMDIRRWGTVVVVSGADVLAPPKEFLRVQSILSDKRTILDQSIRTVSGKYLGRCKDVQFDTASFRTEWLFPKAWFRWGTAIPVSEIVEVTPEAIIVKDPLKPLPVEEAKEPEGASLLPQVPEAA